MGIPSAKRRQSRWTNSRSSTFIAEFIPFARLILSANTVHEETSLRSAFKLDARFDLTASTVTAVPIFGIYVARMISKSIKYTTHSRVQTMRMTYQMSGFPPMTLAAWTAFIFCVQPAAGSSLRTVRTSSDA